MSIKSLHVQNLRCIQDATLSCDQLTALIGRNGTGKSSFLHALNLFYTPNARYTGEDFYDQDTTKEILITITFIDLTPEELELFKRYVEGGELLIGVADDRSIIGIDQDRFSNDDKFLLHLRNLIVDKIIPSSVQYIEFDTVNLEDKSICHITCKKSAEGVWLKRDRNTEIFYVRSGPSSTELSPSQAVRYINEHFQI